MSRNYIMHRQQGFSLIDIMVGIVIALVAMLVVYQVFAVGEQFKRNTTSIGEAQVNGLLASFALGLQLANSGNALALAAQDLISCEDHALTEPDLTKRFAKSWRPLPILVFDSGSPDTPDSFLVSYSTSTNIVAPAPVIDASKGNYVVQSPNGFHSKTSGDLWDDLIVAIERTPNATVPGKCVAARVTNVVPSANPACTSAQGCVELTVTGAPLNPSYSVFNIGAAEDVQKIAYEVVQEGTSKPCAPTTPPTPCALRSTRLVDNTGALAAVTNPLASNIVNLKVQYGIDTDSDGLLDDWVPATGQWAPDVMTQAGVAKINQIKAVRIGVIVRSDQFDKNFTQDVPWSMFDGANKITGTPFKQSVSPPGNWRYRVYETVVPLRNEIWNKQS
jgi:type IV pilus assembly protein PilW